MKRTMTVLLFTCAWVKVQAQVNFVKNPDFERYDTCPPDVFNTVSYANFWSAIDTLNTFTKGYGFPEYCNRCLPTGDFTVPKSSWYYQNPRSGNGMAHGYYFCDESPPPPAPDYEYRDYLQGRLFKTLSAGKSYCVTFYLSLTERTTYATNKMGAYLDDGSIDTVSICSKPITFVRPQVYTDSVIKDTMNWTKIEGSFVANGTERFITLGNFFPLDSVTYVDMFFGWSHQWALYLIDDVSVIESDLPADAGADTWVEEGKTVQIGRVGDTTAIGLDCKWYHKGALIDSGAIISVNANSIKYAVDTFVVVQTICGLVKSDTVLVKTVGLGMKNIEAFNKYFSIYPNPSSGTFTLTSLSQTPIISGRGTFQSIKVYNLLGQVIYEEKLKDKETNIQLNTARGLYIVEVADENQNRWRERIVVE